MNDEGVSTDLDRPLRNGADAIDMMSMLLWLTATGIIASIVFLTALERTRDFAVMKATGSSNRVLLAGLGLQGVLLSLTSAVIAVGLALLLAPLFTFSLVLTVNHVASLLVAALTIGLLASLVSLRRVASTDPALAFGGAG